MKREVLGRPVSWHVIQWAVFFLCFSVVTWFSVTSLEQPDFAVCKLQYIAFDFRCLPIMLFAGLFGYAAVFSSTFLVFVIEMIRKPEQGYLVAVFVMAALVFSIAGQRQAFKSRWKCFFLLIVSTVLIGVTNMITMMLQQYTFNLYMVAGSWAFALSVLPACFAAVFISRVFFTAFPDHIKCRVALGLLYYNKEFESDETRQRALLKNRLSRNITILVLVEAGVLVTGALLFSTILMPDLRRMNEMREQGENYINWMDDSVRPELPAGVDEQSETPEGTDDEMEISVVFSGDLPELSEEDVRFVVNRYGLTFLAKLSLMLFCIAAFVAGFANLFAQVRLVIPITALSRYMVRFSKTPKEELGDYAEEVKSLRIRTRDEIEELYHAVDVTVHEMVKNIRQIEEDQKLKEDLRVAEASNRAKSEFLSNMSHEIRTPINAVLGLDEMILREAKEEGILEYAKDIRSAGNTLLSLVNDILDSSKIESGKMEILPVHYELASLINDVLNMIRQKADDKGLSLIVKVQRTIPHLLFGDEIRIKQCILNILTNAVKYTEKGSVTLTISHRKADEDHIFLSVRVEDTGIGIKEEDIEKLFRPFERIEEIRNRTIEGTGLGMNITQKLLAMMDTKLEVKSVYGEGSDFSFEVLQEVQDWKVIGNFDESYRLAMEEEEAYSASFQAPESRILVTDDTVMNLTVIKGLLKETLLQVETAESGKETLQKAAEKKYDVILLDHRMPVMDGIETKQALDLMENSPNKDTPIIALTANAVSGARDLYMEAGFSDYLSKPIDAKKLEKMLLEYLPAEKVILPTDPAFVKDEASGPGDNAGLPSIDGVDPEEALKNCGSKEVFYEAAKNFLTALPENAAKIEEYAQTSDFRNYTVLVHALKSSARLLGASELSSQAAYLETCGNEENAAGIAEKTPELLALYRSYEEKLSPLFPAEEKKDLPEISEEELEEAYAGLREFVDAFDFDSADRIMEMLAGYEIPYSQKDKYDKIGKCMAAVDRDGLLELLA